MSDTSPAPAAGRGDGRRLATNIYITTMFLIFPLFVGFSGYEKLTVSKFLFFAIATALWILALLALSIFGRRKGEKPGLHHIFALCFIGIVCISALLSPYGSRVLLGAGRYDGLVSQLLYACIFLGVSMFGRLEKHHMAALGLSVSLCCAVAVFQLFDINILGLFPGDYSYYDKGIRYSGEFLGTMGNTNVLSEFMCLAIPLFFILPVLSRDRRALWGLVPLFLAVFVMIRANVAGGLVALGGCALLGTPVVIKDMSRLRRALGMAAFCLIPVCLALAFSPEYTGRIFSFSFDFGVLCLMCLALAVLFAAAALLLRRISILGRKLQLWLGIAVMALIAAGLTAVYFTPSTEGTIYELSRLLHGQADDSFGSSRILIWRECLEAWKTAPLFGHGPDTVALTVDIDFSRYVEETGKTLRSSVDNAHNIYLGYLVNTGLLGLAAYIAILVCGLIRWLKNTGETGRCALGLALLCSAIQGFFALGLCLSAPVFWIMLALLLSKTEDGSV